MLAGKKDKTQGVFRLRHVSPNKIKGFSVLEILLVALISSLIIGGLFFAFSTGEYTSTLSSAKADLGSELRRTMSWITQDVREAVVWDIANNSPSTSYIKFRPVIGWNTASDTYYLDSNYLEYTYNADSNTITRRLSDASDNTIQTWNFNYITQPPFYTRDASGNVVALDSSSLLNSKRMIVVLTGQKEVRGTQNIGLTLTEEAKIRNE
jgi:type II secretory pathway pseudopilin PulG